MLYLLPRLLPEFWWLSKAIDSSQLGTSCLLSLNSSTKSLATFRFFSLKNEVAKPKNTKEGYLALNKTFVLVLELSN